MPVENTRIVVRGAPKADREFTVVERTREEAAKLVKDVARDADALRREFQRAAGAERNLTGRR